MKTLIKTLGIALTLSGLTLGTGSAGAWDRNYNPPGPRGGPGSNWENPPGPAGGAPPPHNLVAQGRQGVNLNLNAQSSRESVTRDR